MATVSEETASSPVEAPRSSPRRRRRLIRLGVAVVVLAALGTAGFFGQKMLGKAQGAKILATAPVRQGEFLVIIRCRGELLARRSLQILAPAKIPNLQIVWMAPQNSMVKEGDPVIRFDPSGARQQLVEKQASLEQAQASLDQALAEERITGEQDTLDLTQARYDVERARLEASKNEIKSVIAGAEARIDQRVAEDKLRVQEATVALHKASGRQKLASLERLRDQAKLECDIMRDRLAKMEVKTPLSGSIVFQNNYSQGWVNAKPFTAGDRVWGGATLAEIPDLTTLEMDGKIDEIDRARMSLGNDVRIKVDAIPEKAFFAKLTSLSPLTEPGRDWPRIPAFRGYAKLTDADARLRPGMNGSLDVIIDRIPSITSIPSRALFTRNGKPVVYVIAKDGKPKLVEVRVRARNTDEVAVEGLKPGMNVSLNDLEKAEAKS